MGKSTKRSSESKKSSAAKLENNSGKAKIGKKSDRNSKKHSKVLEISGKNKTVEKSKTLAPIAFGTARGIESMFRNSYRANLDMITLAATKANIMISLNGSLLALLTLSSAFVLNNEPLLLFPMSLFLLTCIASIFFAVLAARPQKTSTRHTSLDDFRATRADLLVFEHFSQLSRDDFMLAMTELMVDREGVYKAMVAHLHFLGCSANRRFKMLRISYSAFFFGLIATLIVLVIVGIQAFPGSHV